ncbi:cytochrome P450 CYP72A616-like [Phragmites australis]|uniref:cytochrome P450 CYP72A616-like n=1 Tax=Phragmites australis TaxID=29695 RepID=UPI002D785809|nr:cytochrome P450 CYP72A616-like [Phragmites australis]XP_062206261.1 cytochrome P450 CYP72A616-like [Phragmites australis]
MDEVVEAAAVVSPSPWSLLQGLLALLGACVAYRAAERCWLRPRRLSRALRRQGLGGTAYRFPAGDLKENARLNAEARSRPMPPCHDVVPRVMPHLHNTVNEHGNICITWFGPIPRVVIAEAELVRDILSNKFGHFEKFKNKRLGKLLALGLASYDGEKWAKHRRILNPAFHLEKLKRMLPAFSTCCTELIDHWESKLAGSDRSYELDIWPEFQNLTGDVISRTAFGSSFMEGRRIFQLQAEQAERVTKAFQYMYIPGFLFFPTQNNRRMNEINREIEGNLRGMIEKRERAIESGESSSNDLLGLLLQSNRDSGKGGLRMTTEEVIEECKLFYFAGMETTSVLLTWTLVVLGMHPEWQERARDEVLSVFGRDKPNFDGLSRLKTVTMILYEVLRLYPPAVTLNRRTFKEMQIGGITYPEGVILELPIILVHHNPDVWGKDAHEFKPARFAEGISKATKDQPAFFPFGWGPRICIGQNFALLEAKMALSMILQRFEFQLSPSYSHAPYTVITLHPQHGAQIILKRL